MNELIGKLRQDGKKVYGFVIWTVGATPGCNCASCKHLTNALTKLAQERGIEHIGLCYIPADKFDAYTKLYKVKPSIKLRNIAFVYRNKRVTAKFINISVSDFSALEAAIRKVVE
ncbi:MAG TPA: hypothetical protein EYP10_14515 [Armatimonadetes bacterium]|nr:hypothetical protein [Armatimonadota bacterium]